MWCGLRRACHLSMLGIHACSQGPSFFGFILEARKERERRYTCLRMLLQILKNYVLVHNEFH